MRKVVLGKKSRLGDLLPEGGILRGKERVLPGVPTEEMRGASVCGIVFSAGPDLVEQKCVGMIGATMQIVLQAAFFLARGINEGAELGFEEQVLALLGAQQNHQSESALR